MALPVPAGRGLRASSAARSVPRRWPCALRAAFCMGVPVLVGWAVGDLAAGLTATMGGFTALYGSGRPYASRAALLAGVALALSAAVGLGIWAASITWVGVLAVVAIATVATLLCNAWEVGPPGAYQFALVCAMGTGLHAEYQDPGRAALLVLAGGTLAWLVHMAGAVFGLRAPEKSAVAAGAAAVADYIGAIATADEAVARHRAAQAMHEARESVVSRQPRGVTPSAELRRLQDITCELHVLFNEAMRSASTGTPVDPRAADTALAMTAGDFGATGSIAGPQTEQMPVGRPGAWTSVGLSLQPHSRSLLVVIRVIVATTLAGSLAGLFGLEHAYWAMTAAVLVLHQGLDRRRTTQRALQRLIGTWLGLVLAAVVIAVHPQALWLVAVIMVLNFLVELTVVRHYTLSVVFITAVALVISTSALRDFDLGSLLLNRGLDTIVGCAAAVAVFQLLVATKVPPQLPVAIADTLDAVSAVAGYLTPAAVTSSAAKTAHRDLQRCTIRLTYMFVDAIDGSPEQQRAAEPSWPTIAAIQRLAHRVDVESRRVERVTHLGSSETLSGENLCDGAYVAELRTELEALSAAVRAGRHPPRPTIIPGVLSEELRDVREALDRQAV